MRSTRTIINATVKSKKKRSHTDPYGGNERPGKKAKSDAIGPPDDDDDQDDSSAPAPLSLTDGISSSSAPQAPPSHYRPRPNLSSDTPASSSSSLPGPSTPSLRPPPPIAFNVDTFNLADSKALERLNNPQLRALCLKYGVDTTCANDGMVANLRQHYQGQQRRAPPPFIPQYNPYYHQSLYYPPAIFIPISATAVPLTHLLALLPPRNNGSSREMSQRRLEGHPMAHLKVLNQPSVADTA
ncbi:hypothetical protein B0H11DRAFT_2323412 [Mycena galericulata]|nr:hypothetical protein B0H11DRAFT_2323412 [Mycena galericulata]